MATAPEVTVICIDNSSWLVNDPIFTAQIDAIKFYCETKLKLNSQNLVGIFQMSSLEYGTKLFPTNDLQQILSCLEGVDCDSIGGQPEFSDALFSTWRDFYHCPKDMKRRLLMFVGSPINMDYTLVKPCGEMLKERRIALDVVNFFVMDVKTDPDPVDYEILFGVYHYARRELGELVTIVNDNDNDNGNSHIVDVDESSVRAILSSLKALKP